MGGMYMSEKCTVYIDEAGDLGIGRGTQWFVLTAVIVNNSAEPALRNFFKTIKKDLNLDNIHFRKLRNFEQRAYVVNKLTSADFEYINIILDTTKLNISRLKANRENLSEKPSALLYNHACRYLIERVSWLLRDTDRIGNIVLSSRGTSRDAELVDYINNKLLHYSQNEIANRFMNISSKPADSWDMLQLADICATSMFYFHEVNSYGFVLPCYAYKLKKFLYQRNGSISKYGMKYYNDNMKPDNTYFSNHMICK